MADEVGLDLVEIAPEANPPVCKIMDFGKYKYEVAQKAREARQNQTHIVVKEVRLTPKIETHDYVTKRNQDGLQAIAASCRRCRRVCLC